MYFSEIERRGAMKKCSEMVKAIKDSIDHWQRMILFVDWACVHAKTVLSQLKTALRDELEEEETLKEAVEELWCKGEEKDQEEWKARAPEALEEAMAEEGKKERVYCSKCAHCRIWAGGARCVHPNNMEDTHDWYTVSANPKDPPDELNAYGDCEWFDCCWTTRNES
jgi:hypothetical protein